MLRRRHPGHGRWRMGGAIRFDGPAGQQQTQNDTKNQLFLFRQAVHGDKVTKPRRHRNNGVAVAAAISGCRIARLPAGWFPMWKRGFDVISVC